MTAGTGDALWAVFADTHGNAETVRAALSSFHFDAMAHLGDGLVEAAAISRETGIPLHAVSGNEDGAADYPETRTVQIGSFTAFLMHGHRMDLNPYQGPDHWKLHFASMEALMSRHGASLLLFGHTHVPMLTRVSRGIICNPGSMFRGSRESHTFAVVESRGGMLCIRLMRKNGGGWQIEQETELR
jgi:uncharacterized protein